MFFDTRTRNVIQIGIGMCFVFFAFTSQGFVVETVLEARHKVDPTISKHAGYYSQTIVYGAFIFSNILAPLVLKFLTPKWSLVLGSSGYTMFMIGFQFLNSYYLYFSSAVEGFCAGILWTAFGHCIAINSNEETIARNSSIAWILYSSSFIFGGVFLIILFGEERDISISENTTRQLYGAFASVCLLGNVVFVMLPSKMEQEINCADQPSLGTEDLELESYLGDLKISLRLLSTPNILLLCFIFAYSGIELSFWSSVYSTSLSFTKSFKINTNVLMGLNSICVGIGELIAGAGLGITGYRRIIFRKYTIVILGTLAALLSYLLVYINLPGDSSYEESTRRSLIPPNVPIALITGVLLGFTDACVNTQIYSFVSVAYEGRTRQTFAIHKFFHALLSTVCMFYGSLLELQWQLLVLTCGAILSAITFFIAERQYMTLKKLGELDIIDPYYSL